MHSYKEQIKLRSEHIDPWGGSSNECFHRGCLPPDSPCCGLSLAPWRACRLHTCRACSAPSRHSPMGPRWRNWAGALGWPSRFHWGWCCFPRRTGIWFSYLYKMDTEESYQTRQNLWTIKGKGSSRRVKSRSEQPWPSQSQTCGGFKSDCESTNMQTLVKSRPSHSVTDGDSLG